jgi:hypothetical protein
MSISGVGSRELSIPSSSIGKEVGASRRMPRPDDTAFTGAAAGGGGRIGEGRVVERIEGVTAAADVAIALLHEERLVPSAAVLEGVESRPLKSLQERAENLAYRLNEPFLLGEVDLILIFESCYKNQELVLGHKELNQADRSVIDLGVQTFDSALMSRDSTLTSMRDFFIEIVQKEFGDIYHLESTVKGTANEFERAFKSIMIYYETIKGTKPLFRENVHNWLLEEEQTTGTQGINIFRAACAINDIEAELNGISKDREDFDLYMHYQRYRLLDPAYKGSSVDEALIPSSAVLTSSEDPLLGGAVGR